MNPFLGEQFGNKTWLKYTATDDIHNRRVYTGGIQASYLYENMQAYNIEDLK